MIIGLVGAKGSGKSTVANYLVNKYNFTELTFAQALKDVCHILSGIPLHILDPKTNEDRKLRETIKDPIWNLSGREWLQRIGTELFRDHFDKDTWLKIIERKIINNPTKKYVISDCRFNNEYYMIKNNGGIIWIINRDGTDTKDTHRSETEWHNFVNLSDVKIINNGTIDDLHKLIDIQLE